jgi:DNA polymerase elongation subunit (family B)
MEASGMKILLLDIETAPNRAFVWDGAIWKGGIGSDMMQESSYVLCWAAKWFEGKDIFFGSVWEDGEEYMLAKIHALLSEADVVVHYNGVRFDIPTLNKEFLKNKMPPPSPYKQIDLYQIVKRNFKFVYNSLKWVLKELGLSNKVKHRGFQLWVDCMEGDAQAQADMKLYNVGDITTLEELYVALRPWIVQHPSHGAYSEVECCPKCGGTHFQRRGFAVAKTLKYARFQCQGCGGWIRAAKAETRTKINRMHNING